MSGLTDKLALLRGLLTSETAFAGPFAATVDATRRCNLRCIGCRCHASDLREDAAGDSALLDLDVGLFERLCAELKAMGTRTLVLSGDGEPLLHPRLLDLVTLSTDAGFRTVLITNGTLLNDERAQALVRTRLDVLRVSLWATSPDEYLTNQPGAGTDWFARVVDGVRSVAAVKRAQAAARPCLTLHMVINRRNFRSVEAFLNLAIDTGCDAVSFSPLHTVFDRLAGLELSAEEEAAVTASLHQAKRRLCAARIRHNINETIHRYAIGKSVRAKVPCYVAWLHPRVKVDGTVQPCNPCDWDMGNITTQPMRAIWNGPEFRQFRKTFTSPAASPLVNDRCDCSFCCYVLENVRIHKYHRWLAPLARHPAG